MEASKEVLGEQVVELIGRFAQAGAKPLSPETSLREIGFDSLSCAELAAVLEHDMEIDVVDADIAGVRTVGELVRVVEDAASAAPPGSERFPAGIGRMQRAAKAAAGGFCRWWFDMQVTGADRLPRAGPVVLCMNHESFLDIPLVVVASPRPVTFMAKRELFEKPFWARFNHELGGFSVQREAFDLRAIDLALNLMERGEVLGMYPEGTRTPGQLLPFLPGAAWIALKTGASLLPASISGTHEAMPKGAKFFKRVPVRIAFGEPIPVERVEDPDERRVQAIALTGRLRAEIEGMLR